MRINNINLQTFHSGASSKVSFTSKEPYNWENDSDINGLSRGHDEFVSDKTDDDDLFDEELRKIFSAKNDSDDTSKAVFVLDGYNKNTGKNKKGSVVVKGAAALAAFYLLASSLFGVSAFLESGKKQKELEKSFKENPAAVAEQLIKSMALDEAAVDSCLNPFAAGSFGSVISGGIDEELAGDLPLGPDSKLGYSIDNFMTVPGTSYRAALDIDGDNNPEISLRVKGDGYVEIYYDHDSDGEIDSCGLYDAFSEAAKEYGCGGREPKVLSN